MQCTKCKMMVPAGSTNCVICQTPVTQSSQPVVSNKPLNMGLNTHKNLHSKFSAPHQRMNVNKSNVAPSLQSAPLSAPAPVSAPATSTPSPLNSKSDMPSQPAPANTEVSAQGPLKDFLSAGGTLDHKFKLNKEIGRGGMGFVYLATDLSLNRSVAIKILPPHYNDDQTVVGRFQREARAMASLDHVNIVTVYSIGFYANLHYFAMKYLPGETLAHTLKRVSLGKRAPLSPLEVIDLMIQACNGLEHAHNKSLLHRDIKPGNLMLSPEGRLCIMDFGIVKRLDDSDSIGLKTAHGKIFGTPEYMPPEQAMGKGDYSPASDLYALAVVGYELLCGELPYVADTPIGIIIQHIRSEVPSLKGRAYNQYPLLEAIFKRCLAKESQDRYTSAAELRTALIAAQQKLSTPHLQDIPHSETDSMHDEDFDFIDEIDSLMLESDDLFAEDLGPNQIGSTQASHPSSAQPAQPQSTVLPTPPLPTGSAPETISPNQSNMSAPATLGLESRPTTSLKPASSRPGHYTRLPIKRK